MMKEVEVQILGKSFSFNIPDNIKTEDFLEIIDFVEDKYRCVKRQSDDLDSFKMGLLTSINIAEEFFTLKREYQQVRQVLERIDTVVPSVSKDGDRVSIRFSS